MLQSSPSLTLCQCTTFRFSISLKTCLSRGSPLGRALNSGEQEKVTRLLKREMEQHSVPQTIHLGWKVVGELYKGELAIEEQDQTRILPITAIAAAERHFTKGGVAVGGVVALAVTLAVALAMTLALAIAVAHVVTHDMMGVDFTKSDRVTKPRFGGGGPHFVHADAPSHYRKIEFVSFSSLTFRTFN